MLEDDSARGRYVVGDGLNPTVARTHRARPPLRSALQERSRAPIDEARARLGDYFAEVLLLDQGTAAVRARDELHWQPSHPGLVDELREGSYRNVAA